MKRIKRKQITVLFVATLLGGLCVEAAPFRFDEASADVQDYVVIEVTNAIRHATIALVKGLTNNKRQENSLIPHLARSEIGLMEMSCVEVLKGDVSVGGDKECFFYETPRCANVLPRLCFPTGGVAGGIEKQCYFEDDKMEPGKLVWLSGRKRWMYYPPYDPYQTYKDVHVRLMLLTPEYRLDKRRIELNGYSVKERTIQTIIGKDYKDQTSEELMAKLGVEKVFSNRVFRLNEGCAFHVDDPVAKEGTEALPEGSSVLMHLSADEVSELVYLAYLVDENAAGYVAATARCPRILKPVSKIKTAFGMRLRHALSEGGMLVQGGSAVVQQPEITEATLKTFFDSIESTGRNVVFTFNKSGPGFVYRIDQQGSQVSEYGERVSVPCHSTLKVFDRHLSLTFIPMTDRQGAQR